MNNQTGRVEKKETFDLKDVDYWKREGDFLHGMTTEGQFAGWLHHLEGSSVWHIDDLGLVIHYVPITYR